MLQFRFSPDPSMHRRDTSRSTMGRYGRHLVPRHLRRTVRRDAAKPARHGRAQIILGNTFHLWMRPGLDVMQKFGGLPQFEQ